MSLDVYLYGERIGTVFPAGEDDYRLAYDPDRIAGFGPGAAILSNSLPASTEPYSANATRTFVEGLLPKGMRRRKLERELGIEPGDGYALIAEIGRDCAGGVCFLPAGEGSSSSASFFSTTRAPSEDPWVREEELEELLRPPPCRLFDPDREERMRFALAGERHKLSLARTPDGRWAWPSLRRPSTHIVKPETGEHPELVANEMFCSTILREAGLPVAPAAVETIAGRRCLVSERFDRMGLGPEAKRFHQETFCQALSFGPEVSAAGERPGGPGFAEAAGLLRAVGETEDVTTLLAAAFCNYMIGNGDAHGENFALMIVHDGGLLAPLYDLVSTAVYDDPTHRGMVISQDYAETAYLLELSQVCEEAEVDFERGRRIAATMATRVATALETVAERARDEGWHEPVVDAIVELAAERAVGLGYEVQY